MKYFSVGDGNKRITTPDRYVADTENPETVVVWDPHDPEIALRFSFFDVDPEDPQEDQAIYWDVIKGARAAGRTPNILDNKALDIAYDQTTDPGYLQHLYKFGQGNTGGSCTITFHENKSGSHALKQCEDDLLKVIESFVIRRDDQIFLFHPQEWELALVESASAELMDGIQADDHWKELQRLWVQAFRRKDYDATEKVGLVFGELMRRKWSKLAWGRSADEYGTSLCLVVTGYMLSGFPVDMLYKRIDRDELALLEELADDTVATMKNVIAEGDISELA